MEPQKLRKAELIKPPHTIKEKIGSGGLDDRTMNMAQRIVDTNNVDFMPIAREHIAALDSTLEKTHNGALAGEAALEAVIYPVMQMKAQGGMFKYPLVTEICDILVNFLETVEMPTGPVLAIVAGHRRALGGTLRLNIRDNSHPAGKALCNELRAACSRYYKRYAA